LFVTAPQTLPLQVIDAGSGVQLHAPTLHVAPPSQPPQSIWFPQLSVLGPQRFWHQTAGGVAVQHEPPDVHTPPSPHESGQVTCWPQLSVTATLHLPVHAPAVSGAQHVPSPRQMSVLVAHIVDPVGPQATIWPQLFITEPQFLPVHVLVTGSGVQPPHAPDMHAAPPSQSPHCTGSLQLSNCAPQRFAQKFARRTHPLSGIPAGASGWGRPPPS
jgi:hypothetical protein